SRATGPPFLDPPTLLTRISTRPKASWQARTIWSTASAEVTSAVQVRITPFTSLTLATVSFNASGFMSTANTCAPSQANRQAIARPLPHPGPTLPAPVTIATLFSRHLIRSEEHTSELQSRENNVCRLLLEINKK